MQVHLNSIVDRIENGSVVLSGGKEIHCGKVIWAAGIKAVQFKGLPETIYAKDGRIVVDECCKVNQLKDVFAIGDICFMQTNNYPNGLPGVAPVAIQQACYLADYLTDIHYVRKLRPFKYVDKGAMATIGRNKAVLDFRLFHLHGLFAWMAWLLVHIYYLIGVRNKIIVLINWIWSYVFYDQALRLNIKPYKSSGDIP